jgi:hypothetical protein
MHIVTRGLVYQPFANISFVGSCFGGQFCGCHSVGFCERFIQAEFDADIAEHGTKAGAEIGHDLAKKGVHFVFVDLTGNCSLRHRTSKKKFRRR